MGIHGRVYSVFSDLPLLFFTRTSNMGSFVDHFKAPEEVDRARLKCLQSWTEKRLDTVVIIMPGKHRDLYRLLCRCSFFCTNTCLLAAHQVTIGLTLLIYISPVISFPVKMVSVPSWMQTLLIPSCSCLITIGRWPTAKPSRPTRTTRLDSAPFHRSWPPHPWRRVPGTGRWMCLWTRAGGRWGCVRVRSRGRARRTTLVWASTRIPGAWPATERRWKRCITKWRFLWMETGWPGWECSLTLRRAFCHSLMWHQGAV